MAIVQDTPAVRLEPDEFVRTGPGTVAGRFMRRFWHPVYVAADLQPGRAVPIRLLSEDFTLYRGQGGTPHAVAFRCAHRGEQLSTGWVEDDCIRCFYHGWKYDASGQCVEQPAEDASFAAKVRIGAYPTREYMGLIFVYFGDGEPPEFPRYPQLESEGIGEAHSYVRECNYFNSIENNLDEVHIAFAHRASTFSETGLNNFLPEISGHETDYGMVRYGSRPNGVTRVLHLVMPNLLVFKNAPIPEAGDTEGADMFAWRVPIDDYVHRSFNVSFAHVSGEAAEKYREYRRQRQAPPGPPANELAKAVLRGELHVDSLSDRPDIVNIQDVVAQVGQGAIADRQNERLGRSDVLLILLRKIWMRELQALAKGEPLKQWRLPDKLDAHFGV
jgi:5,5'-dehydrodivanillate O-demethylase